MAAEPEGSSGSGIESWIGRGNNALHRGIGPWGVVILGLAAIGLAFSGLLPFSQVAGLFPGVNLPGVLGVGLAFCLVLATSYAAIASAVGRSGADYILASRVISAPMAFVSSWVFVLMSGLLAGSLVAFVPREMIPLFGKMAAEFASGSGWANALDLIQQPQAMILVGTTLIVLAYVGLFLPQRSLMRVLALGVLVTLAGWVIMDLAIGTTSPAAFSQAWDRVMGAGNFASVLPAARRLGFQPVGGGLPAMTLAGALTGLFIFFGFTITAQMAGEIKKPERSIWRGNWLGLLVIGAALAGTAFLLQRATPSDWLAAQSYLNLQGNSQYSAFPWVYLYAGMLFTSLPGMVFLALSWLIGILCLVQAFLLFISRIMLAWADDGLLPGGMAYVHPRFRSPLVTLLVAAILVQIGLVDGLSGGALGVRENYIYFSAITMVLPVLAITVFPFVKRDWFKASPAVVRLRIGPLPVISLVGLVSLAYLIGYIAAPWMSIKALAPAGNNPWIIFGGMAACGLVWYMGRRLILNARGVKIEENLQKLPRSI